MMLARPASRTAASNGKSCSSRISRGPRWTGAWLSPPSARPCPTMCLPVAMTPSESSPRPGGRGCRRSPARRRVRILAVGLLDPAPARIARHVEHRRERMPGTGREHPSPDRRRHRLDELGIPGRRRADRLLEARRVAGHQAVQRFLVDDRRDAEPRLLDQVALDLVGRARRPRWRHRLVAPANRVIWPMPRPMSSSGSFAVERPDPDDLERPDGPELGDLLLDGHPAEQVADPLVDRQAGVAVGRLGRGHPLTEPAVKPPTICRSATA